MMLTLGVKAILPQIVINHAEGVRGGAHLAGTREVVEGSSQVPYEAAPILVATELMSYAAPQRLKEGMAL